MLALVAYLMGNPDRYADLQVTFSSILNAGVISVEERAQAMAEGDGNYRTRESTMELIGITDLDAMAAAVKKQQGDNSSPKPNREKSETE